MTARRPLRPYKRVTPEERRFLKRLHNTQLTIREISNLTNRTAPTQYYWCGKTKRDKPTRGRTHRKEPLDHAADLSQLRHHTTPGPLSQILFEEQLQALGHALRQLPHKQRRAIGLFFGLQGRKLCGAEIGRRMRLSRERIRQLLHRGLIELHRLLTKEQS